MLVRPESNSQPPAWQLDAQTTEPPLCEVVPGLTIIALEMLKINCKLFTIFTISMCRKPALIPCANKSELPLAEPLLSEKHKYQGYCEILRNIFQLRALSYIKLASLKRFIYFITLQIICQGECK